MAANAYIGVNGVARRIKAINYGVNNIARKVSKGYIGVNGIARLFYTSSTKVELEHSTTTPLSLARYNLGAATAGDRYLLFAGGYTGSTSKVVDAYDKDLTRTLPTALRTGQTPAAVSFGGRALFGETNTANTSRNVFSYDDSLTMSELYTSTEIMSRSSASASKNNAYALFAQNTDVSAFDTNFTRRTVGKLQYSSSYGRRYISGIQCGNYGLFAGGEGSYDWTYNYIDAYDSTLTWSAISTLSTNRGYTKSVRVGNYVLFAGGHREKDWLDVVDAYDSSMTRLLADPLSVSQQVDAATDLREYGLVGIGEIVDVYTPNLTRTVAEDNLSVNRTGYAAATVNNIALFGGGVNTAVVDTYKLA